MNPIVYIIISVLLVTFISLVCLNFGINYRDYNSDIVPFIISIMLVCFCIFQIFSIIYISKSESIVTNVVNKYKAGELTEITVPTENGNITKYRY